MIGRHPSVDRLGMAMTVIGCGDIMPTRVLGFRFLIEKVYSSDISDETHS